MQTAKHKEHIASRVSHMNCPECTADRERRFTPVAWPGYKYVAEYLAWAKPRIEAIRSGESSVEARIWLKDFRKAMNKRITYRNVAPKGRKYSDGYLERLGQFVRRSDGKRMADATYLRQFARAGASCLR